MVNVILYGIGCNRFKTLRERLENISRRHKGDMSLHEVTSIEGILEHQIPRIPAVEIGTELHVLEGQVWDEQLIEKWINDQILYDLGDPQ
jgi:hypothetical protein